MLRRSQWAGVGRWCVWEYIYIGSVFSIGIEPAIVSAALGAKRPSRSIVVIRMFFIHTRLAHLHSSLVYRSPRLPILNRLPINPPLLAPLLQAQFVLPVRAAASTGCMCMYISVSAIKHKTTRHRH